MTNLRLLLVDDRPELLRAMERGLRRHFQLSVAMGPGPAIRALRTTQLDIVLSDDEMPDRGDGLWVLCAARVLRPAAARLLMSGRQGFEAEVEANDPHLVEACLRKPFGVEQVLAVLARR